MNVVWTIGDVLKATVLALAVLAVVLVIAWNWLRRRFRR